MCSELLHFKSKRLVYRAPEFNESDKRFLHNQIVNDPTIQTMSTERLKRPLPQNSAEEFLKLIQDSLLGVLICLPASDKDSEPVPIGHMNVFRTTSGHIDHHRSASLGISLAPEYRGQGYGGEAINWALDWAFQHAGLHRVKLEAFSYNQNALKLYRKLGFVEEGRERECIFHCRAWHDIVTFSMLEHEWELLRNSD